MLRTKTEAWDDHGEYLRNSETRDIDEKETKKQLRRH